MDILKETVEQKVTLVEKLTNDFVAIIMTVAILSMAIMSISIPEWLIGFYGLIIAFYFKK